MQHWGLVLLLVLIWGFVVALVEETVDDGSVGVRVLRGVQWVLNAQTRSNYTQSERFNIVWLSACNPVNGWNWLNTALLSPFICLNLLFHSWILHFLNAIQVLSWVLKWKPIVWLFLINSELLTAFTGERHWVQIDRLLIRKLPRLVKKFTFLWIVMIHFNWRAFFVAFRHLSNRFCLGRGEIL